MGRLFRIAIISYTIVAGCSGTANTTTNPASPPLASARAQPNEKLAAFFEAAFQRELDLTPLYKTYLGIVDEDYSKLDDISDEHALEALQSTKQDLAELRRSFDRSALNTDDRLSYRLFEFRAEQRIAGEAFIQHDYPVQQMYGPHTSLPGQLINQHRVDSESDARAYIARLKEIPRYFRQLERKLRDREKIGVLPPAFVFPKVVGASRNIITGAPFDSGPDSALYADIKAKITALKNASPETKTALISDAKQALLDSVRPAYISLIALLESQQKSATTDHGVWKLPTGAAYYAYRLRRSTTRSGLSADAIHATGIKEVARIHEQMRSIKNTVGFDGDLQKFFHFTRTDPRFFHPNNDAGRAAYLNQARAYIAAMEARLDEVFITKPKDALTVKRVEIYREKAAGKAFYSGPAADGSRPGIFYANLRDMDALPNYQLEALAYHEGTPGHHMQNSIAQGLQHLPKFRRFGGYTAYGEGWGLYTEMLPKEMGFYQDPYSDFGRLAMELWRAARLVVDTGIHHKKWTRQQAIDYLATNTPNPKSSRVHAIERYIVMPGQATAYKIGMLEILRLRALAKTRLGKFFDLRTFHEVVLTSGPVPLEVLAEIVEAWIIRVEGDLS